MEIFDLFNLDNCILQICRPKRMKKQQKIKNVNSSVTYPKFWRCHHVLRGRCVIYCERCECGCGGCASLMEMIHLQWRMTVSPERDSSSPAGDAASPSGDLQNSGYVTLLLVY
jgi:hypothetical protein